MAASYNVFLIGRPPIREVVVQPPITLARFVDAVAVKYNLTADAVDGISFRWVDEEPDADNAARLFKDFEERNIKNTASLSKDGVIYIVGKLAESE